MNKTIQLPLSVVQKAEVLASDHGVTLQQYISNLLEENFHANSENKDYPPWMKGFGKLADLSEENRLILKIIDKEFEVIDDTPS